MENKLNEIYDEPIFGKKRKTKKTKRKTKKTKRKTKKTKRKTKKN